VGQPIVPAPAAPDGSLLGNLVDRGDPHQAVDDAAGRVGLAEVQANDPGDEVELGHGDQAPVQPADHDERGGKGVQLRGGPLALLACAPHERHDLGLICFGLALRARGWRIAFLGADTPVDTLLRTAHEIRPDLVVLTATTSQRFSRVRSELRELGDATRLAVAGAGATGALAASVDAELLDGDPVSQAVRIVTAR
jgi:B12 binding domain